MSSEEVGVLRKLGKQAVWLLRKIRTGVVIDGATDEPNMDLGEEDGTEDEEGGGEEEIMEDGADFLDAVDADDGYSPHIDPITTATLAHDGGSEALPTATISDADLVKAKQRILNSLSTRQAETGSSETNAGNEDGIQNPTQTHIDTGLEEDGEEGLKEGVDGKAMLHATLDMLVTIIGEFYGQRDLLGGRLLWDEMQ